MSWRKRRNISARIKRRRVSGRRPGFQYASRRQRSRYRSHQDSTFAPDLGGHSEICSFAVVCAHRIDPRSGQGTVPLGRAKWGVVGDTFPMDCVYSKDIVFTEYFNAIPTRTSRSFVVTLDLDKILSATAQWTCCAIQPDLQGCSCVDSLLEPPSKSHGSIESRPDKES
jgi:hypothetical protein